MLEIRRSFLQHSDKITMMGVVVLDSKKNNDEYNFVQ